MNTNLANAQKYFSQGKIQLGFRELVIFAFAVDSIGSVYMRGAIWVILSIIILVGMDSFHKDERPNIEMKRNLGFFLLFVAMGGILTYLLFGFAPFVTTANATYTLE